MPLVVAPLAAIVVAIVAVILLYAFYQLFHPLLEGIANAGGLIGSTLASVIDGILSWAYGYASRWAKAAIRDVVGFILAPIFWIEHHIEALTQAIRFTQFVLGWSMNTLLPLKINQALSLAHSWDVGVQNYAAALVGNLTAWTRSQFASTDAYIAAGLAADANYAAALFRSAEQYTTAGLAAESAYMASGLKALESFTTAGLAAQGAYAQQLFTSAINYTGAAVGGLSAGIEKDLSAITSLIGNAELSLATSIALAQAHSIAYTDARVGEVEGELGRWADGCLKSMCGGLGDLAKLFNAINDGWQIAGIIALIGEVLHDPHGVAAGIESAVVTPARDVLDSVLH